MELEALDQSILTELQRDGRITNAELADRIGLSPSACLRRIRRLEETGVIDRYVALLDPAAIGRPTSVFVEISLNSQHEDVLDAFEAAIVECPEVMSCHLMAGAADYLVQIRCADVNDFERIHRAHLARLPGVANVHSSFALRTVCDRTAHQLTA
jgi:Lrp/AsnC family leucine-responsive transcriptional regulator